MQTVFDNDRRTPIRIRSSAFHRLRRLWDRRTGRTWLVACTGAVILGLLLRLLHVRTLFYSPLADMATYITQAGYLFDPLMTDGRATTIFPPGYPLFLKLFSSIRQGISLLPVLVVQALLDSFTILAVASIGRRLFHWGAGIAAAYLYAAYSLAIFNTGLIMTEAITTDLILVTVALFLRYSRRPALWLALAVGFTGALTTYFRSNCLVVVLVLCFYALFANRSRQPGRRLPSIRHWLYAAAIGLTCAAALAPWSIRNSLIWSRFEFIATNYPMNLLIGNHPYATGGWSQPDQYADPEIAAILANPEPQRRVEMQSYARRFMATHWAYELFHLVPRRAALLLWEDQNYWPWHTFFGGAHIEFPFGPRLYFPTVAYMMIFATGCLGFLLNSFVPRRGRLRGLLPILFLSLILPIFSIFAVPRFRLPADPLLIIGTGEVLRRVFSFTTIRRSLVIGGLSFICLSALGSFVNWTRFSGPNLAETAAISKKPRFAEMLAPHDGTPMEITTASRSAPFTEPLGIVQVNPGTQSHVLISFDYELEPLQPGERGLSPNLTIEFLAADGKPLPEPRLDRRMFIENVTMNSFQAGRRTAWRVVRIPAATRAIELALTINYNARLTVSNFQVRGPIWSRPETQ